MATDLSSPEHIQSSLKWRKRAIVAAWIITGAGFGLFAVTIPFVIPALRKHCLPYVPATPVQIRTVVSQLKGRSGKVVDLGSGDGRVVIAAAKQGHYAVGYELNLWLVLYSRWKALISGVYHLTEFHKKDLWKVDLSGYNSIIIFGVDSMMEPLKKKIINDLSMKAVHSTNQNTCIITCRFPFPNQTPTVSFEMGADSVWIYHNLI